MVTPRHLLYAYDSAASLHTKARRWTEEVMSSGTPVDLPWQTIGAFLRVVTNPSIPGDRFTVEEATQLVDRWLEQPMSSCCVPKIRTGRSSGRRLWRASHAQLTALTIEYGGILHNTDRDFARFPALRWTNPLIT